MSLDERMYMMRVPAEQCGSLKDKPVSVNRTAKVVKGGRRFGFSAFVISGDGQGHVGYGHGKASEVPEAVRKASEGARKNLIKVALRGSTVAHEVIGKFGGTQVILKPAEPGTGVIAGPVVRAIVEACGIRDIRTKVIGSSNAINVLYATFDAFTKIREPERVAQLRGLTLEELGYAPY